MTFLEAAYQVLKSSGRPLTTLEITERALEQGLVDPRGKTPTRNHGRSAVSGPSTAATAW
jgi:hypothetical protein